MGEGVKRGFASVCTLPRVSDATKGQSWNGAVIVGIVDGSTARSDFVEDYVTLICRQEDVEKEL